MNRMLSQWPDLWDDEIFQGASVSTSNNLDVYETEEEVVVRANIAGVPEDDIDMTFEKGVLWIKASAQKEEDDEKKKHHSRSSWSYSYKIAVPGMLDFNHDPEATVDNGVVTITFKKSEGSKPKKLSIKKK